MIVLYLTKVVKIMEIVIERRKHLDEILENVGK